MEYTLVLILLGIVLYILVNQKKEIRQFREGLIKTYNKLLQLEEILNTLQNNPAKTSDPTSAYSSETASTYEDHIQQQIEEIINESPTIENPFEEQELPPTIFEAVNKIEELQEEITEEIPYHIEDSPSIVNPIEEEDYKYTTANSEESSISKWYQKFKNDNPDIEKFIGENLINKIGVLILVLGISFFVKYAIDKDWINEPSRVGIGILSGALILTVAHKLRTRFIAFSSVLVAGAISVFYFTIGIAFHDYQLFSQTSAFLIMSLITIFAVLVSIFYNRQELGVLSTIAGFAVPFMVSTGTGNYIVLLTYMAILNIGMLSISFYKRWFIVNFTALIASFMIISGWYALWEEPTDRMIGIAFIFCTAFYLIFITAFTINNIVYKNKFRNYEIAAAFLSTALYYAIGYHMIDQISPIYLGVFTIGLGLTNMLLAYLIYKYYKFDKNIIYIFIGLSLTFATITIPIQLDGNYVTLLWACEAVVLFWLSKKSKMPGFTLSAIIVQSLALFSTLINLNSYNELETISFLGININYITNLLVITSLIVTYRLIRYEKLSITLFKSHIELEGYPKIIYYLVFILGYIFPIIEIANLCFTNSVDVNSMFTFIYLYHMIYTAGILWYNRKISQKINISLLIMIVFNMLLYVVFTYRLPLNEIINNYSNDTNINTAFYLHYITIGLLIYQVQILFKETFLKNDKSKSLRSIIPWGFAIFITYTLSAELNVLFLYNTYDINSYYDVRLQVIKVAFPILWGIIAFGLLIYGIKHSLKPVRIIALTLLGITIVKLFTYDIKDVSETGKIIAFILLGVLILVISFVYQKIKKLVVDDNNEK